jgi:phosphoribosyl-ATP pyrophosphohydrolase/phosphoribosyl-AMP cyclohydrolase/histidinol dehydrogenase
VYWSRRRGLWEKGATSGAEQELVRVDLDCDRDAIRFTVRQRSVGFCHEGTFGCWGDRQGVPAIADRITERIQASAAGSYTARLASDADLLRAKLVEEAGELAEAVTTEETIHEAADLLYFTMTTLASRGVGLDDVVAELERRTGRVTRRGGDAKTPELETTP